MKKIISIILSTVIGAVLLLGGCVFGAYMYDMTIPHFDNYYIGEKGVHARLSNELVSDRDAYNAYCESLYAEGYCIRYPDFWYSNNFTDDLIYCYAEVEEPLREYAFYVARRYNNRARLDPEVECTKTRLTIKFTGYGVLEDGTREELDRTYIFDIEGVGKNKLPKLLNKAEIYPEIL
ncbi:MAG: hypothetical protein K2N38_07420 [Oscillospiraceae bacterium]|nr:hypothetical protein [Oscillospiraceae bacterium]